VSTVSDALAQILPADKLLGNIFYGHMISLFVVEHGRLRLGRYATGNERLGTIHDLTARSPAPEEITT
jgi:hypothetical protein